MAKFQMKELIGTEPITARLGAGSGSANYVTDVEIGKPVKLVGDSQYGLCAVGNEIEAVVESANEQIADGFLLGTVRKDGRVRVTLDGLQATPGTGVIAVGVGGNLLAPAATGDFDKVTEVARQYADKFAEIKGK